MLICRPLVESTSGMRLLSHIAGLLLVLTLLSGQQGVGQGTHHGADSLPDAVVTFAEALPRAEAAEHHDDDTLAILLGQSGRAVDTDRDRFPRTIRPLSHVKASAPPRARAPPTNHPASG